MDYILIFIFSLFMLWLGTKILDKAGLNKLYILFLLIPVVNLIVIWVFAFTHWPNLKPDVEQDI